MKTMNINSEHLTDRPYEVRPGDYALLTVKDEGTGMDKETLGRVFDPFFTTKEVGRGNGLGLPSSYGIIKAHGGYIDIYSEKGHGTSVNIYLPRSEKVYQEANQLIDENN